MSVTRAVSKLERTLSGLAILNSTEALLFVNRIPASPGRRARFIRSAGYSCLSLREGVWGNGGIAFMSY